MNNQNEQAPSKEQFFHPSVPAALRRAGEELDFIAASALEAQAAEIESLRHRLSVAYDRKYELNEELNALRAANRASNEPGLLHGVPRDRAIWICSVCNGWNHLRDKFCTHTHAANAEGGAPVNMLVADSAQPPSPDCQKLSNARLNWAMSCGCDCQACVHFDNTLRSALTKPDEQS
jgi:hypothetical protein